MQRFQLKAAEVVTVGGIPVRLCSNVDGETSRGNRQILTGAHQSSLAPAGIDGSSTHEPWREPVRSTASAIEDASHMKATVKMSMFNLPNFLKIDGPIGDSNGLDVGYLFPHDKEAGEFWDDCREKWIAHVRQRRDHLEDVKKNGPIIGGQMS